MKPLRLVFIILLCSLFLVDNAVSIDLYGGDKKEIRKTFKNKTAVNISTFSGDCVVKKSSGSDIEVFYVHTYSSLTFEPQFIEEGDTLVLKEKFRISGSGESIWNITVPEKTNIHFNSISGSFSVEGLKSKIYANTVSGEVRARNCSGELDLKSVSGDMDIQDLSGKVEIKSASSDLKVRKLSGEIRVKTASGDVDAEELAGVIDLRTPSGDVDIKNAKGSFEVKSASGDIEASGITITKPSYFKVASGDLYVSLARSADHDLTLDSASGDAVLNYNGNPIEGYFEFKALFDRGEIIAPFPFDREEEEEKWGKKYVIKSFKRGVEIPKIYIYTATGKAVLKEK
jgi:DUF4097 and DUF4098 domain-containing protein YvlB